MLSQCCRTVNRAPILVYASLLLLAGTVCWLIFPAVSSPEPADPSSRQGSRGGSNGTGTRIQRMPQPNANPQVKDWVTMMWSLVAGMSTGAGGLFVYCISPQRAGTVLHAALLGVAVGVMATLSVVDLIVERAVQYGWEAVGTATVCGILVFFVFSNTLLRCLAVFNASSLVPKVGELPNSTIVVIAVFALHNLPEGFAVGMAGLMSMRETVLIALSISLHNIPEGIAVALPIFAATNDRLLAVKWALVSGLTEPLGALVVIVALRPYLTLASVDLALAAVGGVMLAVCGKDALKLNQRVALCGVVVGACKATGRTLMLYTGCIVMGSILWLDHFMF